MKSILVTGGAGFLGRNTALALKENGYSVIGMGYDTWENDYPTNYGYDKWIESSITPESLGSLKTKIDAVVHCAGSGSVGFSFKHPEEDFRQNFLSVLHVLEFIRNNDRTIKLIYPSSAAIYGQQEDKPLKESEEPNPVSPYGYNKLLAEKLCKSYSEIFNMDMVVIRFFSIYGPGLKKQLLWEACKKINDTSKNSVFFGTGNETRDWIHIKDAANLIVHLLSYPTKGYTLLNGGSGIRTTVYDVISLLIEAFGYNAVPEFSNFERTGDPKFYTSDITLVRKIGWENKKSLEDGINEYVKWYLENK